MGNQSDPVSQVIHDIIFLFLEAIIIYNHKLTWKKTIYTSQNNFGFPPKYSEDFLPYIVILSHEKEEI